MIDNQHNIFSVPIWGFLLREQQYQSRDYLDYIKMLRDTQPGVKKSNMLGYQTHDNLHLEPVFREFREAVERIGSGVLTSFLKRSVNAQTTEMWGNINPPGASNGSHVHGEHLSGVFYITVPSSSGRLILCNPAVRSDGHLLRTSDYPVNPEPLACIMFPSWLEHRVEPNLSSEDRISISFNLRVCT